MKKVCVLLSGLLLTLASLNSSASSETDAKVQERITASLQQLDSSIQVTSVSPTPIADLYLVQLGQSDLIYVSGDGNHVIQGDMLSLKGDTVMNLTDGARSQLHAKLLDGFPRDKMIVFPAEGKTKAAITVFTDVDCGYCRKLHNEVPELNALGVEVRYMAFPRGGKQSSAYSVMENVWCAADPKKAMTQAKRGQSIPKETCDNPVQEEYELGVQLGIRGTPALFLDDGAMIPGYRSAESLAQSLGIL